MASQPPDWRARAAALLDAGRDLRDDDSAAIVAVDARHAALLNEYVRELREAKRWDESWWKSVWDTERQRSDDDADCARKLASRYPIGAGNHGAVIALLRKYWLACMALNEESPPDARLAPEHFLLGVLIQPESDLAKFISTFPYWPIGMDADGKWV
jgi:hypothetical protein